MRYPFFLILSLMIFPVGLEAQVTETEVSSKVEEVVIFRTGAQEFRTAKTSIENGNSVLKFTNLPNTINPNSIQIKGVDNFTVMAISYRLNYLNNGKASAEVQILLDSMEILTNQLNYTRKKIFVLEQEKKLFTDNKNMVGKDSGLDADELEEMLLLYGKQLVLLESEMMEKRKEETKINERYSKLYTQYSSLAGSNNKSVGEILVTVTSKSKIASTEILVSYYMSSAGWYPHYDIRAKDTKSDIEIDYKAGVWQNSGTDWENVNLTLSSSSPNFSNTLPELANWYLQFGYNYEYDYKNSGRNDYSGVSSGDYNYNYSSGSRQSTGIEFKIEKPYTIISDGKEYRVDIGKHKVPATFSYFAVPKLDESAFILARLTGWYDLNLLPGNSKIYFGNSFVGDAYLNPEIVEDTLDVSLGNDEAIIIKRENITDFNQKTIIGSSRKKTETFEISVRNNRSHDIRIKILDQIPVSTDKEVVVTPDEYEGAAYKKENGELSWILDMKSAETKKVRLQYTVKYPKNKIISNL
jgi:hypothetical protein